MSLSNILDRLHFPSFIVLAKERYGEEGEMIMEEVLARGHATLGQITTEAVNFSTRMLGVAAGDWHP